MIWKLDNTDFADYHVRVTRAQGVLDMPRLRDNSHDWLDEDGRDYWEELADLKFQDREIILNCYIKAGSESEFQSRLKTFYNALKAEQMRLLSPPFGDPVNCYLDKEVLIDRRTKYVTKWQLGVFVLRFTVPGDPEGMPVEIKRWTGSETIIPAVVFTNNLRVNKTLQGDIYATLSFESPEKLPLKYFDYIQVNSNGVHNDNFHLATEPAFRKLSTNKYVYDLRLEHQSAWLDSSNFLNLNEEAEFYLHANLEEIIDLIIDNHNRRWWGNFAKGSIFATERRLHKFSGETCLEVLRRMCSEYQLEYEFEYIQAGSYSINVKEQVANTKNITLEYGKGKGLYDLFRENANRKEIATILYAFGSQKNLKPGYRGGIGRLSFDGNPLIDNEGLHDGAGPHEKTVFFEDIFPQRTGTVSSYTQKFPDELTTAEKYVFPDGIFKLTDNGLDFDINDYLLGGLTAKIKMTTGDLAGFEFEIQRYDDDIQSMFLIRFKDERGELFPNDVLKIKAGDKYKLIDIDLPDSYVEAAEAELEAAALAVHQDSKIPDFPYRVRIDPAFVRDNAVGGFEIGDRLTVVDADFSLNNLLRISQLIYDAPRRTYDCQLASTARLTHRQQMELRIRALERALESTQIQKPENQRKDLETTAELRGRLLFPENDKLKVEDIMKNNTVGPRFLDFDAGVPQFYLSDALVETNVDDDEDKLVIGDGTISITNWAGLHKYDIAKMRANNEVYDPTRTWEIEETTFNLQSKDGHWLYAKISLDENEDKAEILAIPEHQEVNLLIEDNILMYKLGHISKGEEGGA